jgi:hypothetical protein
MARPMLEKHKARATDEAERNFLAGEIPRVFERLL